MIPVPKRETNRLDFRVRENLRRLTPTPKNTEKYRMNKTTRKFLQQALIAVLCLSVEQATYAAGPFTTGASALSTDLLAVLTPVAVIAVMVLGALAWFGRISWMLAVSAMIGIVLVFGSQQVVTWVRGLFGV
jgi:type IV secretion system protein VirB2